MTRSGAKYNQCGFSQVVESVKDGEISNLEINWRTDLYCEDYGWNETPAVMKNARMHAEETPSADVTAHLADRCDLQVNWGQWGGGGRKVRRVSEDIILLCSIQNQKFTAVTQSLRGGAQLLQLEWTFSGIKPGEKAAAEVWWTVLAGRFVLMLPLNWCKDPHVGCPSTKNRLGSVGAIRKVVTLIIFMCFCCSAVTAPSSKTFPRDS